MNSSDIHRAIMLQYSRGNVRLWRNNSGCLPDGRGGFVTFGVGTPGGSDLIGIRAVTITPDMVGRRVGVFVALEAKTGRGRPTQAQENFIERVKSLGGIAGVCRSVRDAGALLENVK